MSNKLLKIAISSVIMSLSLSGCATFNAAHRNVVISKSKISQDLEQQRGLSNSAVIKTVNTPYLMGEAVRVRESTVLPAIFHQTVHLSTSEPLTLGEFATQITQMTGVPIHVSTEVSSYLDSNQNMNTLPSLPGVPATNILPNQSKSKNAISVNWNGSLSGLLNLISARTGVFWKYERGHVRLFLTETRSYNVDALPGTTGLTSSISNSGSSGSSGGGSSGSSGSGGGSVGSSGSTSQTASDSTTLDIYKSIESGVKSVLAQSKSAGGDSSVQIPTSVSVNESTGQVVVTASPSELRSVSRYIRKINQEMQKNVMIDVHVYSVSLDNANNYNMGLNLSFTNIGHGLQPIKISSPQAVDQPSGEGTFSAGIVTNLVNANMIASALATQGNVSLVTSGSVIAMNGQPTPMQVAHMHSYVASSTTTQTASVGSATAVTPGQFTTGFSATFLPLVRNKKILLEYTINLTQNLGLQSFTSGQSTVQLPNLAMQAFMQRVAIRSGQTLVLSGFEQKNNSVNHNGIGSSHFWGLGGGGGAIHNKTALVVVIHVVKLGD